MLNILLWQNNLLKFYLDSDVNKAIDYGKDLIDEIAPQIQDTGVVNDLKFSLATAHSLKLENLEYAIDLYNETIESPSDLKGIVLNNLGITHFYKFMDMSNSIQDPTQMSPEQIEGIMENMKMSISCMKQSVVELERFESRF